MTNHDRINAGVDYLKLQVVNGLCLEFHQLGHGASDAWTSFCVGSALSEFKAVPAGMLDTLLGLQDESGGWSYNHNALPDPDSTLRALQFLNKLGFNDPDIINRAERFVISHQLADGGIATYLPESVRAMGYPEGGWTISHLCVTALATNVLRDKKARAKAIRYVTRHLKSGDARAYWWRTPWYVRYEYGCLGNEPIGEDVVEIALALLLMARLGMPNRQLLYKLTLMQLNDGSFPASHQFRIPRPNQFLDDITDQTEVVEDSTRIFSTAAAVVAISRQEALI